MQVSKFVIFLFLIHFLGQDTLRAQDKVIYGKDDRKDIYEVAHLPFIENWAGATISLINNRFIDSITSAEFVYLENRVLGESSAKMCKTERFLDQPYIAGCTGFLIAPDIIATAGHCIDRISGCQQQSFIFNYSYKSKDSNPLKIKRTDVYSCKEVIARTLDYATFSDFAIIRLDRHVKNYLPVTLNTSEDLNVGDKLTIIGSSIGLPLKVAPNGMVRENNKETFFTTTLDSYAGNSGSPVFNEVTGAVEGILVRGEKDFITNGECKASKVCAENECSGEDVVRASQFSHLIPPLDREWEIKEFNFKSKDGAISIPDDDSKGLSFEFEVTDPGRVHRLSIHLDIEHEFFNDLVVLLYEPSGKRVFMMWKYDVFSPRVSKWFGDKEGWNEKTLNFRGFIAAGTWKIHIGDYYKTNVGKVNGVKLHLETYR